MSAPWQQALRVGLAPQLSTATLTALLTEVEAGGPRLIKRSYVNPLPSFSRHADLWQPWQQCCLVGMCAALSGAVTSDDVARGAERIVMEMMHRLAETHPAYSCCIIAWWDDTPREESLPLLATELREILAERG